MFINAGSAKRDPGNPMAGKKILSDREHDLIAEITRLIAEGGEDMAALGLFRQETTSEGHDEVTAPQLAGNEGEAPHGTRWASSNIKVPRGVVLAIAVAGLALLGTAGAFSYRQLFRGSVVATLPPIIRASNEPNKIAPVSAEPAVKNGGKDTTGSIEKLVSREEQPVLIEPPKRTRRGSSVGAPAVPTPATVGQPVPNQAMPLAVADPPGSPLNAVASQHALQAGAAGGAAGADGAHLTTAAVSTAETTPPVLRDGYTVQVTSERSENAAQAAYSTLQAKYPNQLGGRQPIIHRADLGAPGTYYRVLVGPFASAEKAAKLCRGLKAAGGDCIVQKN